MVERIAHGGGLDAAIARHGGAQADWLDLSTGINPRSYPLPPIESAAWQRLPDHAAGEALKQAARACYRVPEGLKIVAANGTQALIELLPRVLDANQVAVIVPTYGEHGHVWRKTGVTVSEIARGETIPAAAKVLVIVNPNNPDGAVMPVEQLLALAEEMRARDGWLVVDEAFCDTSPQASLVPVLPENAIVLRSFGKFFGLAGLRLGFAVCQPKLADALEALLGPWAVSGPAMAVGSVALPDSPWIGETRQRLEAASQRLIRLLETHGFEVCGAHPLFVLASHGQAPAIAEGLAQRHILVRSFAEMPGRLRLGLCGSDAELQRLDTALSQVMAGETAETVTSGRQAHG